MTATTRTDLARLVSHLLEAHEDDGFGWRLHQPADDSAHLLVTCEPDGWWRAMPGQAVRQAVARHLRACAYTLAEAGMGVAKWGRDGQTEVLLVAATQADADEQAPAVWAWLRRYGTPETTYLPEDPNHLEGPR